MANHERRLKRVIISYDAALLMFRYPADRPADYLSGLPADVEVIGVRDDWDRMGLSFILAHPSFEPVPPSEEIPVWVRPAVPNPWKGKGVPIVSAYLNPPAGLDAPVHAGPVGDSLVFEQDANGVVKYDTPPVRQDANGHHWRLPKPGEPAEENGVCRRCGAFANSAGDRPCGEGH